MRYNLFIRRYNRNLYFDTLDDLKTELSRYFTPKEKASGIVEKLTNINNARQCDGYKDIDYQDIKICFYTFD